MDRILCFLIYVITFLARFAKPLSKIGIGNYEEWSPGSRLKVLLVGYNGARNTGSDVRVVSIARQVKELFGKDNVEITVMTLNADSLKGYFDDDVKILTFSSLFPLDLYRACSSHHVAILCEGSTLKSTFANALTLFLCEASGVMSAQNKPCIAYGSEVGSMESFLKKAAERLCKDTYFITRTEDSFEALKKLGLTGHAGTDAAWLYDGAINNDKADKMLRDQGWDGVKPLLGIAVINPFCWPVRASLFRWIKGLITGDMSGQYDKWYFFSDSEERRNSYYRYINEIASGASAFIEEKNYFPVLIGMEKLDEKACRMLKKQLPMDSAMFLSGRCSADIMTGILHRLSLLITSRYHASVLSMEGGCPIIAVSMDERLDNIMRELSYDGKYLIHTTDIDFDKRIYEALVDARAHEESIHEHILVSLDDYKIKLDEMGIFMKHYIENTLEAG